MSSTKYIKTLNIITKDRLDFVLIQLNLARSLTESRNLIKRGLILVNHNIIFKPSTIVKCGDIITNNSSLHRDIRLYNYLKEGKIIGRGVQN